MSSILDALRKLDEQKNARKQGPIDIAAGVVRPNSSSKLKGIRPWQIGVTLALVAGISVLLTMLAMLAMRDKPTAHQAVSKSLPPVAPPVTVPSPAQPLSKVPVTATPPIPTPLKAAIHPVAVQQQIKMIPSAPIPAQGLQPTRTPVSHTEALVSEPTAPAEPSRPVHTPTVSLKLTGIGWQKDATSRFAVINGTAVGEGGFVDGAKVDEILPDKVRLKVDGKTVEIALGK